MSIETACKFADIADCTLATGADILINGDGGVTS